MKRPLFRDPRLYGMALMAPATLLIVVMHSFTTGRVTHYFAGYLFKEGGGIFTPQCASLEYDLLYSAAFISFFFVVPLALAAQIGDSIVRDLRTRPDHLSSSVRFASKARGSIIFLLAFILIHAVLLPLLLHVPLGRLLWVEHNMARNVVLFSPILLVLGSLAQLVYCVMFRPRILTDSEGPFLLRSSTLSPARRAFQLLIGTPLGGIAFWLVSAICIVVLFKASVVIFGAILSSERAIIFTVATVMTLSLTFATFVGIRLRIWRSPVRALIVIVLVTLASQLSQAFAFPIDWFEVCRIWTD